MQEISYDIYINYSTKDNTEGWIDRFRKILKESLRQLMGDAPNILYYPNQEKPTTSTLAKVGVMFCVLSPNFISDRDCIEDVEAFVSVSEKNLNKRIIKVVKYPVEYNHQPTALKNLLSYDLYLVGQDGEYVEMKEFFGKENERIFWTQVLDMAQEAYNILREHKKIDQKNIAAAHKGKTIFLAETTNDLQIERNLIRRELQKFGCVVVPDQNLPSNHLEIETRLKRDLERSELAIHLIGASYGEPLKEDGVSLLELQNTLATEHSTMLLATKNSIYDDKRAFSRIIWLPPQTKFNSERQKVFVDNLLQNTEALEGAEILQVPLEDLKKAIRRILSEQEAQSVEAELHAKSQSGVYLIYDPMDAYEAKDIVEKIKQRGFEVLEPELHSSLLESRKIHINNLLTCKAAIVYNGKVSKQWVAMKLLDLLKAPGFGRDKPLQHKAVLSASVFQPDDFMKNNHIQVIQLQNDLMQGELNNFLATIS
ncbi:MAG: hypothetical protein OHK0045_07780 [Raineya sp.]